MFKEIHQPARMVSSLNNQEKETLEQAEISKPRFDNATLARISNLSTSIRCECPQHLAELVFRISAFERYSSDCQNRNELDAAIHARLKICAGKARMLFEESLAFLIDAEGLNETIFGDQVNPEL
jgi:hypothetical protein